jgi:hypothetical protein
MLLNNLLEERKVHKLIFISLVLVLPLLLAACGSAATPAVENSAEAVNMKLESKPSPVAVGDAELIVTITDATGNPIEGATVDVSADHTDMSGMGMNGAATDQGFGKYSINANFSMSGNWKLTVYVRNGQGLDYKEDIELKVH